MCLEGFDDLGRFDKAFLSVEAQVPVVLAGADDDCCTFGRVGKAGEGCQGRNTIELALATKTESFAEGNSRAQAAERTGTGR